MPNLLKNVQSSFQEAFKDKIAVAFMALVLVVAVNHIVFSYLLFERDTAEAFTASALSEGLFFNFNDQEIQAGTNDVMLIEFDLPDAALNTDLACGFMLDIPNETGSSYDNVCMKMIDADGYGSLGAGINDDKVVSIYDFALTPVQFSDVTFDTGDCIFTDNWQNPTEVYYDINCNGYPGDALGQNDVIILDLDGSGVMDAIPALPYLNVANSPDFIWVHTEVVGGIGGSSQYDFDVGKTGDEEVMYMIEGGSACGGSNVPTDLDYFTIFADSSDDEVFDPSVDTILWDPNGCLSNGGPCANGGCMADDAFIPGVLTRAYFWNGDGTKSVPPDTACAGLAGDGIWQPGEPSWFEDLTDPANTIGVYDELIDTIIFDPNNCLAGGEVGEPLVPAEKHTESIWIINPLFEAEDQIIHEGSWWDSVEESLTARNQFQGDEAGVFTKGCGPGIANGECWMLDGTNNKYDRSGIIIDVDGDGIWSDGDIDVYATIGVPDNATTLQPIKDAYSDIPIYYPVDCDADDSESTGACEIIWPGDPLVPLPTTFSAEGSDNWSICTDSLNFPAAVFADEDGQCDGGAGVVLYQSGSYNDHADDIATINPAGIWSFKDSNTNGLYDPAEDIYFNPFYEASAGNVVGTEMQYFNLIFADINQDGLLDPEGKETIFADLGVQSGGPSGSNNGLIDFLNIGITDRVFLDALPFNDLVLGAQLRNFGTAIAGVDYDNVRIYVDPWPIGSSDGRCTGPGGDDLVLGTFDVAGNSFSMDVGGLLEGFLGPGFAESGLPVMAFRACAVANIPTDARTGATIRFGIDKFQDLGRIGLFDENTDKGAIYVSGNSGPTDGPLVSPFTIKIVGGTRALPKGTSGRGIKKSAPTQPVVPEGVPSLPSEMPADVENGDVVMGASTNTVYAIVSGKRKPFPDMTVYLSWFDDPNFQLVKKLTDSQIAGIKLADSNMTMRSGTWLIKNASSPNVYVVEPNGVRRLIETETVASELFGENWQSKIVDVPDKYWADYTDGPTLSSTVYPTGSLVQYAGTAEVYYIEEAIKRPIDPPTYVANHFQDKFIIRDIDAGKFDYPTGPALTEFTNFFMTMEKALFRTFSGSGLR